MQFNTKVAHLWLLEALLWQLSVLQREQYPMHETAQAPQRICELCLPSRDGTIPWLEATEECPRLRIISCDMASN